MHNLEYNTVVHSFITCTCPLSSMVLEGPNSLYIGSWDGQIKLLDLRARSCSYIVKPPDHTESPVRALTVAAAPPRAPVVVGKKSKPAKLDDHPFFLLAAHGTGAVTAWDMRQASIMLESYHGHTDVVNAMCVDNGRLYTGADDKTICIFDLNKGTLLDTLVGWVVVSVRPSVCLPVWPAGWLAI